MPGRCVFVQYTAEPSGSPISGLAVVDVLRQLGLEVTAVFAKSGSLEAAYAARGCQIVHVRQGNWLAGGSTSRRFGRWLREVQTAWRFLRLYRTLRPRLVYANTLVSLGAVIAARVCGIRVVWHIRELFDVDGGEMIAPLGGIAIARAVIRPLPSRIVCVSKSVQRNVLGADSCSKASVIYNPLFINAFDIPPDPRVARESLGMPKDCFMVGLPGTFRPVKGHEFLLEAARRMSGSEPGVHFAFTGDLTGSFARCFLQQCQDLGLTQNLHFVGEVDDMRTFYAACDIVCVPSRAEAFPRTVIEAFAQRRAVIAARTGGIPESVEHGTTGLLVDYGDVEALVSGIRSLRQDEQLRGRLATAAFQLARDRFHPDRFRQDLCAALAPVLVP